LFVTSFVVLGLGLVWLVPQMRREGMTISAGELLAPFFSDVILLFLGGFVLSTALHKFRLDEQLAHWMLTRTSRRVPVMLLSIMIVTATLSMWLSNTATAAMMLAICLPIARQLPVDDAYRKAILLAVPFAANVGGLGTPIGSPPNAIAMQYMQQSNIAPSFGMWMLIGVPGVVAMIVVAWAVLMLVYRGRQTTIEVNGGVNQLQWSPSLVFVVGVSLATVAGWITSGLHGLSAGTVALFPVIAFFGTKILTVQDLKSLSWDVLLMMGGGLCLGAVIAVSGLAAWLVELLPIDNSNCFVLLVVMGSAACVMSSVMSNTATANVLMPIVLGLGITNLSPVLVGVAFACTLAMPLPVSTPPNAIAFSSEELTVKDMLLPGSLITVTGLVLALTTGHWWWDLVGLF
jgi:sodium-dependent dicarboxylate transporter 2/3/5